MPTPVGVIAIDLRARGLHLDTDLTAVQKKMERFGERYTSIGRQLTFALSAPLLAFSSISTRAFAGLEQGMRSVNTLARLSEEELSKLTATIRDMGLNYGRPLSELTGGLYEVYSSGFAGSDAVKVLDEAVRGSIAGVADARDVNKALVSILNAYSLSATHATDVSDVLFKTVERGIVSYSDLVQNMGQVIAMSSATDVSIGEVGAAIATMTKGGFTAANAVVSLSRVLDTFIKPSKEFKKAMKDAGFASGEWLLRTKGLGFAMNWLQGIIGGSATTARKYFKEIRALRGALALTRNEGKTFAEDLNAIAVQSNRAGSSQKAFEEQTKSFAYQLNKARESIRSITIAFGEGLAPIIKDLSVVLSVFGKIVNSLPAGIKSLVASLATVGALFPIFMYGIGLWRKSLLQISGPISRVLSGHSAIGRAIGFGTKAGNAQIVMTNKMHKAIQRNRELAAKQGKEFVTWNKKGESIFASINEKGNARVKGRLIGKGVNLRGAKLAAAAQAGLIGASTVQIKKNRNLFKSLADAAPLAMFSNLLKFLLRIGWVITLAVVAFKALSFAFREIVASFGEGYTKAEKFNSGLVKLKRSVISLMESFIGSKSNFTSIGDTFIAVWKEKVLFPIRSTWSVVKTFFLDKIPLLWEVIKSLGSIVATVFINMGIASINAFKTMWAYIKGFGEYVGGIFIYIWGVIKTVVSLYVSVWMAAFKIMLTAVVDFYKIIGAVLSNTIKPFQLFFKDVLKLASIFIQNYYKMWSDLASMYVSFVKFAITSWRNLFVNLTKITSLIYESQVKIWSNIIKWYQQAFRGIFIATSEPLFKIREIITGVFNASVLKNFIDGIVIILLKLSEILKKFNVFERVVGFFKDIKAESKKNFDEIAKAYEDFKASLDKGFPELNFNLPETNPLKGLGGDIEKFKGSWEDLLKQKSSDFGMEKIATDTQIALERASLYAKGFAAKFAESTFGTQYKDRAGNLVSKASEFAQKKVNLTKRNGVFDSENKSLEVQRKLAVIAARAKTKTDLEANNAEIRVNKEFQKKKFDLQKSQKDRLASIDKAANDEKLSREKISFEAISILLKEHLDAKQKLESDLKAAEIASGNATNKEQKAQLDDYVWTLREKLFAFQGLMADLAEAVKSGDINKFMKNDRFLAIIKELMAKKEEEKKKFIKGEQDKQKALNKTLTLITDLADVQKFFQEVALGVEQGRFNPPGLRSRSKEGFAATEHSSQDTEEESFDDTNAADDIEETKRHTREVAKSTKNMENSLSSLSLVGQ